MHHGLSTRDVPLPALMRALARLRRNDVFRRRSWGFSLRSFAPAREVLERFRSSFPTCRLVGFHLDLFLSRDRPSDIVPAAGTGIAWGPRFTHIRTEKRPIAEVHLDFWVSIPGSVRFPPSSEIRRDDPALGLASSRFEGTATGAPARTRNFARAVSLRRAFVRPPIRSWACDDCQTRCIGHVWSPRANPCNRRPYSVFMGLTPDPSAAFSSRPRTIPCVRFCTCRKNR
jgi:hypothetical protein